MSKFKAGDVVSFGGSNGVGTVLLVNGDSLMVDVGVGKGHDGVVRWTRALGWRVDGKQRCWFVDARECSMVRPKVVFKGNIK